MQQEWSWRKKMENCKIEKNTFCTKTSNFWQLKTISPHFWGCPGVPRCVLQKFFFCKFKHLQRPVCQASYHMTSSTQLSDWIESGWYKGPEENTLEGWPITGSSSEFWSSGGLPPYEVSYGWQCLLTPKSSDFWHYFTHISWFLCERPIFSDF